MTLDHATRSAAKRLAQDVTAEIPDRHQRARVRTHCYNQTVTLLDELNRAHLERGSRVRLAALTAAAAGAALGGLITWVLVG